MPTPKSLTTASLVEWLKKRPPLEHYDYVGRKTACMIHQYLAAVGLPVAGVTPVSWSDHGGAPHDLPEGWDNIAYGSAYNRTFGGALERAREQLARERKTA